MDIGVFRYIYRVKMMCTISFIEALLHKFIFEGLFSNILSE